jgi:hypothetical protein
MEKVLARSNWVLNRNIRGNSTTKALHFVGKCIAICQFNPGHSNVTKHYELPHAPEDKK